MRGSVSTPGGGSGPGSAPASAASRSGPMRVRTPFSWISNDSVTGFCGSPSASSRSTASWRSSSWSNPRSSRSAMPPSTMRMTASQAWPTGAVNSMRSDGNWLLLRCGLGSNRRGADHLVAAHEAGHLAGRDALDRLGERQRQAPVTTGPGILLHARPDRARAVAELHGVDLGGRTVQGRARHLDARDVEGAARADDHASAPRVLADHVERLAGGDAEAAALPDGEQVLALVRAEPAPVEVHDLARLRAAAVAREEVGAARAREEAQVLALGALGDRQPRRARD